MKFLVEGADRTTGEEAQLTVEARDEVDAEHTANKRNILVSSVVLLRSSTLQRSPSPLSTPPANAPGAADAKYPVRSVGDGWVLNPDGTFPLTVLGVDQQVAIMLRGLMDDSETVHPTGLFPAVAALVAQTGLRCREIDDYVAECRQVVAAGEQPDIVPYCNLDALFNGNRLDSATGGGLVRRYGFENLRFYSRHAKMIGTPRPIPESHRDRKRFEELARAGLATIGAPISKGAKAGPAFSLNALEGPVSVHELASWIGFCMAVGELLTLTYTHSAIAARSALGEAHPDVAEILKGYKLVTTGDDSTCRHCARMDGKKYPPRSRPKVPFHLGCRCTVIPLFD